MKTKLSTKLTSAQGKHLEGLLKSQQGQAAVFVLQTLRAKGFEAYWAGGCVRDLLLGRTPADYDIASNASPEDVEALFVKTVAVGKQFGIIVVVQDGVEIEVARFRGEKNYKDGRHPEEIYFSDSKEDALRRDFTINALFLDVEKKEILDFVGGVKDLEENILRAVGSPDLRFQEDHLRILRALRFVSQLGCELEESLQLSVLKSVDLVLTVSRERFFQEWEKLLQGKRCQTVLQWIVNQGLWSRIFPNLRAESSLLPICFMGSDSWASFWIWLSKSGNSKSDLELAIAGMKASKKWQNSMLHVLFWFLNPQAFSEKSLGESLELSFQDGYHLGLSEMIRLLSLDADEKWQQYCLRKKVLGDTAPAPLLTGVDIQKLYQGSELGMRLRKAYWAQLAGLVTNRGEALKKAQENS